jgi:GTPase SAR1 family protein
MNKLDQLSQVFSNGANVVIFCSENDRREIFEELAKTTPKEGYGVFKNELHQLIPISAMVNGRTFHFISEQQLDKLIVDLEKIEI